MILDETGYHYDSIESLCQLTKDCSQSNTFETTLYEDTRAAVSFHYSLLIFTTISLSRPSIFEPLQHEIEDYSTEYYVYGGTRSAGMDRSVYPVLLYLHQT